MIRPQRGGDPVATTYNKQTDDGNPDDSPPAPFGALAVAISIAQHGRPPLSRDEFYSAIRRGYSKCSFYLHLDGVSGESSWKRRRGSRLEWEYVQKEGLRPFTGARAGAGARWQSRKRS